MAVTYYLVALMVMAAIASGEEMAPIQQFSQPKLIGLKTNFDKEVMKPLMDKLVNTGYLCEECERFIRFLKNVTEDPTTLAELVQVLLPICDWVPYVLHQECITTIQGIPALVKAYGNEMLNPKVDCATLCLKPPAQAQQMDVLMQLLQASKPINKKED